MSYRVVAFSGQFEGFIIPLFKAVIIRNTTHECKILIIGYVMIEYKLINLFDSYFLYMNEFKLNNLSVI